MSDAQFPLRDSSADSACTMQRERTGKYARLLQWMCVICMGTLSGPYALAQSSNQPPLSPQYHLRNMPPSDTEPPPQVRHERVLLPSQRFPTIAPSPAENIAPAAYESETPIHRVSQIPDTQPLPNPTPLKQPPTQEVPQRTDYFSQAPCTDCAPPAEPEYLKHAGSRFEYTWLPGSKDVMEFHNFDFRTKFAFPTVPGFTIQPQFSYTSVEGPNITDLPPNLYSTAVEFGWMKKLNAKWAYELAIAPGYYSDYQQANSDGIRIIGRALAFYGHSRTTQLAFGVVYLDRENLSVLPAAGLIYAPREDLRLELVFPRPRLSFRVGQEHNAQQWFYLAGEFGGGSWAVERASSAKDVATYSDLRFLVGLENKASDGLRTFVEAGYVFSRELEYKSGIGDFKPKSTGVIRLGLAF